MLLTPHLMTGAMASSYFGGDIITSLLVTFATYFFVEAIPHWDPENPQKLITQIARYFDFFLASIIVTFVVYVLFQHKSEFTFISNGLNTTINYLHIVGVLFSLVIYLFINLLPIIPVQNTFTKTVIKIYKRIKNVDRSFWGIFVQFGLVVVAFATIFRFFTFPTFNSLLSSFFK